jgi:hypothetical protein
MDLLTFLWTKADSHSFESKIDAILNDKLQFPYFPFHFIAYEELPIEPWTQERQLFGRKIFISVKE